MTSRRTVLKTALAFLLAGATTGSTRAGRPDGRLEDLPPSDHFDGSHFFNPNGDGPDGLANLLKWKLNGEEVAWPSRNPSPFPPDRPPSWVKEGLRIVHVGHSSFLVQGAGLNILLDPVWSMRASPVPFAGPRRHNAPGIGFDDLPRIDAVLVSHNHYDHLDQATLRRLHARDRPLFIAPLGNETTLRGSMLNVRVQTADWNEAIRLSPEAEVRVLRAQHWSARGITDRNRALWGAYAIRLGNSTVYFAGDTGFADGSHFREAARFGPFDVALLPIGAYAPRWFMKPQHMNPDDAVQAFGLLGARHALGCHWGTFQLTDEGIDQPAIDLAASLTARGVPAERFLAARPGQVWESEDIA